MGISQKNLDLLENHHNISIIAQNTENSPYLLNHFQKKNKKNNNFT